LNMRGQPLMPTTQQKANKLLKQGNAKAVKRTPFTIQLKYATGETKQPITLGIDSGYKHVGFSAVSGKGELISGELKLRVDVSKRIQDRAMYRRTRRNKLWYRKPRFDNRAKSKKKGWLSPSIMHKVETHIRLVDKLRSILPITKVIVEVAKFDTHKLQDIDIKGAEYQQGQMQGYDNLRAFVLYRDNYTCQICNKKDGVMNIHHIIQRKDGGSDRPDNLVTVHKSCHDKFHSGKIKHNFTRPKSFRQTVIMNNIRRYIVDRLDCDHTYGYITKRKRIDQQLQKSPVNDAFVIAESDGQSRCRSFEVKQVRRNNRCIQLNRKGFAPAIRRQRYQYQPNDIISVDNKQYRVKGVHCKGTRVMVSDGIGNDRSISLKKAELNYHGKGLSFEEQSSIHPTSEKVGFFEVI
ncbi:MAG: HNH endonuclease, partial [Candidatus Peribacteraceae bacterium]|nr:HNH endonuclease [Candidatus Peribacteraceae bacterium]